MLNFAYKWKSDEAKDNLSENCDEAAVDKSDISPFMEAGLNPFTFLWIWALLMTAIADEAGLITNVH